MSTQRYAFFDVDGTVLNLKSMMSFQVYYYTRCARGGWAVRRSKRQAFRWLMRLLTRAGCDRSLINRLYYRTYKGRRPDQVRACARNWYAHLGRTSERLFVPAGLAALREHQNDSAGVEPVFVSGSAPEILAPVAEELGVAHILATQLEVRGGRYTGRIEPPQVIGEGKRTVIQRFLDDRRVDPSRCYAYGDHSSDLPMLESVGHPRVIAGDPELDEAARQRGWQVLVAA